MTRLNIRFKHHKNGTTTISGIPTLDYGSVFTAASLQQYQREDNEKNHPTNEDNKRWLKRQRAIIDILSKSSKWRSGYEDVPLSKLKKHERAVRLRDVKDARRNRLDFDRIMKEIFSRVRP